MNRPSSRRMARWGLGAIVGLGAVEWGVSAIVYRPAVAEADWTAAATAVDALPADEPIWLGTPWLGPHARMQLPRLAGWEAIAPPDLRGVPRFHVLGLAGDAWAATLEADREDLPTPTLASTQRLGGLALYSYTLPEGGRRHGDFVGEATGLQVQTTTGTCRGRGPWTCPEGRVAVATVEVDHRPRRCLRLDLDDGATVRLSYPGMTTGTRLRGHLGTDDFNARLRSDSPVRLRLAVDGQTMAQWLVSDVQGWWPFAVATTPGTHDVQLEVTAAVRGTWQRRGYQSNVAHAPCVELRSVEEGPA